jgi:putative ABC transport system permease protein
MRSWQISETFPPSTLRPVIETVDAILVKVALVIRIMSLFAVGTGLDRAWKHDLERDATSAERERASAHSGRLPLADLENSLRGIFLPRLLASATGIVLALAASWALAKFVFELDYTPSLTPWH